MAREIQNNTSLHNVKQELLSLRAEGFLSDVESNDGDGATDRAVARARERQELARSTALKAGKQPYPFLDHLSVENEGHNRKQLAYRAKQVAKGRLDSLNHPEPSTIPPAIASTGNYSTDPPQQSVSAQAPTSSSSGLSRPTQAFEQLPVTPPSPVMSAVTYVSEHSTQVYDSENDEWILDDEF